MKQTNNTLFDSIKGESREFLLEYGCVAGSATLAQGTLVPVYEVIGDEFSLIADYIMTDVKGFEKSGLGPQLGLYRGGGDLVLKTQHGNCTMYDERYGWYRLPAGITLLGVSLEETAIREGYLEELFPITIIDGKEALLVPLGVSDTAVRQKLEVFRQTYGVALGTKKVEAKFETVLYTLNSKNSCIEAVVELDLSGEEVAYVSAIEDAWFRGGVYLPPVYTMQGDQLEGMYSPRQGFVPFSGYKLHPTVEALL